MSSVTLVIGRRNGYLGRVNWVCALPLFAILSLGCGAESRDGDDAPPRLVSAGLPPPSVVPSRTNAAVASAALGHEGGAAPPAATPSLLDQRGRGGGGSPRIVDAEPDGGSQGVRCREQAPQAFLLRQSQLAKPRASAAERREIEAARERSIDYRTLQYGKFPGFGHRRDNPYPPRHYAELTHFMGLPVLVHRKVVPALACVEAALQSDCRDFPYRPTHLGGLRDHNTYADYEVSSHVYGIAIDIDPDKNPCCGCLGRWKEHPSCRRRSDPVWARMAMPQCWVRVFERYGFRWLGHDELEDTMHFEFLGDPDRVLERGGPE